jgi:lipid II:glycine glycyltransferase (peptidoglycan interpeptide bridge formation enzyme)
MLGNTVMMDLSSSDTIWANLTSKNRNMVRKAQKSGVEIYHGQFPVVYQTFKEIYNMTMDSDNAKAYYYFGDAFYDSIRNDLPEESQVFWAEVDGKIIAASIMLLANGYMNYHLSGSLREYQSLAPSNLLLYKAALWGCRNGCRSLHLGGGVGAKEDSLYKFKSAFNRNETRCFNIGRKIFLGDVYEDLVAMKNLSVEANFFPLYRA